MLCVLLLHTLCVVASTIVYLNNLFYNSILILSLGLSKTGSHQVVRKEVSGKLSYNFPHTTFQLTVECYYLIKSK